MKCKQFFLFAFILLFSVNIYAQSKTVIVAGIINDTNGKPIEGAIVSIVSGKDSSIIKALISETNGRFEAEKINPGIYFIKVSHVGYETYSGNLLTVDASAITVNIPIIILRKQDKQLSTVTVQAKTAFVERKIDRTVVNVNALISNAGSNLLEILQKSPGVTVDENGGIKLKGKSGVLVYIDDKPTYLSETDLANYLRSLPSGAADIIEIMTNPPAKYDAAGNAGIINIRLKKTKAKGFNGGISISYGQGVYARTNNNINFNYRVNKINFFSSTSYNINNTYQDLYLERGYYKPSGNLNSIFNQNSFNKKQPSGFNVKLGADYYINKKSTLGIVLTGFSNIDKKDVTNTAYLLDSIKKLQNIVKAKAVSKRVLNNKGINLNYAFKPDSTGKEWLFNIDYLDYSAELNSTLLNSIYLPDESFVSKTNLIGVLPSTIKIFTAKLDYTIPSKNGTRLDVGAKTSFINTNNIANFFDENNNVLTSNNDFSNNFTYKENINAAYVSYSLEKKRFSMQAGLRFENTTLSGHQLGNMVRPDSAFKRNFNSLFPTFYANYKLDSADINQLGFSYGRRINRPDYQSMNPFTYPLDRFTLYGGNPYLRPTFSNNFEVSHTWKNRISTTLQYSYITDVISETIEQGSNIFYSRPGNFGKQVSYGVNVNAVVNPFKWWTIQLYTELMKNKFTGRLYNQDVNNVGTHWLINGSNQFVISSKWSAELSGSYQSRVYYGQFVVIPFGSLTTGIARKLMKDKATIKASLSDIFYTSQRGGDIKSLSNSTASWYSYFDSRFVTVSFSYRFNKGKSLKARETGGSESEKGRVKMN